MTNWAPNGQLPLAVRGQSLATDHFRGPVISSSGLPRLADQRASLRTQPTYDFATSAPTGRAQNPEETRERI